MEMIKLAEAVIAVKGTGAKANVLVFRHLDNRASFYDYYWGACESIWQNDPSARFRMLFEVTMFMIRQLEIPAEKIAKALRPIPECGGLFSDD
ncbi:hypothetical protein [Erythrobacter sp. SAORIC-644]|uniref:hypothetical protein n=1 Tax=Erythrobacter sp. SAORIC-644 TaxID=1869314 RepID=UPI0011AF794C|nr:hypothetical protein [Erythrobacter sp. SAORIC-644]